MDAQDSNILQLLSTTSDFCRAGDYGDAARSLNQTILCLEPVLAERSLDKQKAEHIAKISYSLETMVMMLEQNNWVGLADVIDYEFAVLWRAAFSIV